MSGNGGGWAVLRHYCLLPHLHVVRDDLLGAAWKPWFLATYYTAPKCRVPEEVSDAGSEEYSEVILLISTRRISLRAPRADVQWIAGTELIRELAIQ
jgi:hypothetical protein